MKIYEDRIRELQDELNKSGADQGALLERIADRDRRISSLEGTLGTLIEAADKVSDKWTNCAPSELSEPMHAMEECYEEAKGILSDRLLLCLEEFDSNLDGATELLEVMDYFDRFEDPYDAVHRALEEFVPDSSIAASDIVELSMLWQGSDVREILLATGHSGKDLEEFTVEQLARTLRNSA